MTTVINIKNTAACVDIVYIGRPTPNTLRVSTARPYEFGNPFIIGRDGDRLQVIEKFRDYAERRLADDPRWANAVKQLKGKVLGCYCKPLACHGDVLVELAER